VWKQTILSTPICTFLPHCFPSHSGASTYCRLDVRVIAAPLLHASAVSHSRFSKLSRRYRRVTGVLSDIIRLFRLSVIPRSSTLLPTWPVATKRLDSIVTYRGATINPNTDRLAREVGAVHRIYSHSDEAEKEEWEARGKKFPILDTCGYLKTVGNTVLE